MLNNMSNTVIESENSSAWLGFSILGLLILGLCLLLILSFRNARAASSLRARVSAIAEAALVLVVLEVFVFGFVHVIPADTAMIVSVFRPLVLLTLVVSGGAWLFARWLPPAASEPSFRISQYSTTAVRELMLGLRRVKTVARVLHTSKSEPTRVPMRPAILMGGRGPALALVWLLTMVAAVRSFASPNIVYSDVLLGYFGLAGGSILLASLPAFVVGWFVLSWGTEHPQVAAALRGAGDLAGRGLIVGFLIGCLGFLSTFLPGADTAAGITGTIQSFVDLSVTGTIVGFYFSLFSAVKRACESFSRPALAFATAPLGLAALLAISSLLVTPQTVFARLAENLVSGLQPASEEDIATLAENDWRYALLAGVQDDMSFVPGSATLIICVTVAALFHLWPAAWRIVREELRISSADDRSQATAAGIVDAP